MKAKVTKEFPGRPDGEALSRTITVGEILTGDLAGAAIEQGWADEVDELTVATSEPQPDLDGMTVDQLKAFAEEKTIDLGDATKKADIKAVIEAALEQAA